MSTVMSQADARRTAWGLVILNLRMKAFGAGSVTNDDLEAIAATLTGPADWGLVTGSLAEIAAQGWAQVHGGSSAAAHDYAMAVALDLAATG